MSGGHWWSWFSGECSNAVQVVAQPVATGAVRDAHAATRETIAVSTRSSSSGAASSASGTYCVGKAAGS